MKFLTCWSQYLDYYQVQSQLVAILHDLDAATGKRDPKWMNPNVSTENDISRTQTYSERFSLIKLTKIMFHRGKFTGFSLDGYKEDFLI